MEHIPQVNKAYILIALNLKVATIEQALENTNVAWDQVIGGESIDVDLAAQIIHNVNRYCDIPHWPTILGAHLGAASHGPVGYATLSAPSVGKAMSTFVEWFQIRCEVYSQKIIEQDTHFEIQIFDTTGDSYFQEMFFESFMRAFEVLMEQLMGRAPAAATKLQFISSGQDKKHLMEQEHSSKLVFGCQQNKLIVPKDIWFQPSPLYDKEAFEFNLRQCQQLLEEQQARGRIDLRVRHILFKHFEQNVLSSNNESLPPSQTDLCEVLHLTERTLIRQLKACNTSYKQIIEEERRKCAVRLLRDARYTVYQVANLLGYLEPANFCRAFKRWTGQSPTEFRRNPNI